MDAEGVVFNIRIHGLRDLEAFQKTDINDGKTSWESRPSARVLTFRQSQTGDIEADIWDDPDMYNRHFIATHPELEVVDPILAKEIADLDPKSFKAELTDEEVLEREIASKKRELEQLKKARGGTVVEEEDAQPSETRKPAGRPRGSKNRTPRTRRVRNGINKPTSGVDRTRVSRVATGGVTEGHPPAVQPSAPDTEHSGERAESTV
jgi:hypothetical protein